MVKQSLVAETNMLKKLSHPSLPDIVDVIDEDDRFLIVMDYIEKNGIPKSIHCRNPYVREALKDSCEKLNIELTYDTFPDIQPDLKYMN